MFSAIFFILFLTPILFVVAFGLMYNGYTDIGDNIWMVSTLCGLTVYIIGSYLSVRFFVGNLSKLARLQVDAPSPKSQQRFLNLSAKYMLLYFIAILSTMLSFVLFFIVSYELGGLFGGIDWAFNLFCLYLQFGFADAHYQKCCSRLDSRCRTAISKRMKRDIPMTDMSQSDLHHVCSTTASKHV